VPKGDQNAVTQGPAYHRADGRLASRSLRGARPHRRSLTSGPVLSTPVSYNLILSQFPLHPPTRCPVYPVTAA
jgi:hypothetical protein